MLMHMWGFSESAKANNVLPHITTIAPPLLLSLLSWSPGEARRSIEIPSHQRNQKNEKLAVRMN